MAHGRNNGKKLMAVRIIAHAFEIVSPADMQTLNQHRTHTSCPPARLSMPDMKSDGTLPTYNFRERVM